MTPPRSLFTQPAIMVPVDDAMEYVRHVFAGVDNLLIQLGDQLESDVAAHLGASVRAEIILRIRQRVAAAREAISEENPELQRASHPTGLAHLG